MLVCVYACMYTCARAFTVIAKANRHVHAALLVWVFVVVHGGGVCMYVCVYMWYLFVVYNGQRPVLV